MPNFIEEIQIGNFRGVEDLDIQDLSTINILVGDNNSGKTSVLEAIKLLASPRDIGSFIRTITSRTNRTNKSDLIDTISSAFKKEDDSFYIKMGCTREKDKIELTLIGKIKVLIDLSESNENQANDEKIFGLNVKVLKNEETLESTEKKIKPGQKFEIKDEAEIYHAIFMPVTVSLYASCIKFYPDVVKFDKKDLFIQTLQIFDKDIKDITIIDDMIWVHHNKKQTMPLFSYGSGVQKSLLISILLVLAQDGIILIDEIESAIHSKALTEVFSFIIKACKELNVQMFATTHSLEAVDKLLKAGGYEEEAQNTNDLIRIITLRDNEITGKTTARVLTGKEAFYKRDTYEMELRI